MCDPKPAKESATRQAMSSKTSSLPTVSTSLRRAPGVSHATHQNTLSQGLQDRGRGTYRGTESVEKGEDGRGRQGGRSASDEDLENFKSDHHHHDIDGFRRLGRYNLRLKREAFELELCLGFMHRLR